MAFRDYDVGPSPEAQALRRAMSAPVYGREFADYDKCITRLKAAGVWGALDQLWVPAANDSQISALSWKTPGSFTLSPINGPNFVVNRGWTLDGFSRYLNTGWVPSTDGVRFTQDSCQLGAWVNSTGSDTVGTTSTGGCSDASHTISLIPWRTGNGIGNRLCDATSGSSGSSIGTRLGMSVNQRSVSTGREGFRDGASVGTVSATSTGRPTTALYIGGQNQNGTFASGSTDRQAAFWVGGALSAEQHRAFYWILGEFLRSKGAQ